MTPQGRRIAWLVEAAQSDDVDAAKNVLAGMDAKALRSACLFLAKRVHVAPESVVERLLRYTCPSFGVNPDDVLAGDRHREVSEARAVTCYAAQLLGVSAIGTGRQLGVDHTSVLYARGRVGANPRLRRVAEQVARRCGWERVA